MIGKGKWTCALKSDAQVFGCSALDHKPVRWVPPKGTLTHRWSRMVPTCASNRSSNRFRTGLRTGLFGPLKINLRTPAVTWGWADDDAGEPALKFGGYPGPDHGREALAQREL